MTKSLSNLIKANFIFVDQNKKIIDSDNSFKLLTEFSKEALVKETSEDSFTNDFVNGVNVAAVEKLLIDEEELLLEKANKTLEQAKLEAESIIESAYKEAEQLKQQAMEDGRALGYSEGYESGLEKLKSVEEELEQQFKQKELELEKYILSVEPKFADITAKLVEKLTNINVEEHTGVILHLIHSAIMNADKSNSFVIRVSKEDYSEVTKNRLILEEAIPSSAELTIMEDMELTKDQCLIETDSRMIDCSLSMQMNHLLTDLRMLAHRA